MRRAKLSHAAGTPEAPALAGDIEIGCNARHGFGFKILRIWPRLRPVLASLAPLTSLG